MNKLRIYCLLLIGIPYLFSCKHKDEIPYAKLEKDIKSYVTVQLKKAGVNYVLDSLRIIRFDTITQQLRVYRQSWELIQERDKLIEDNKLIGERANSQIQIRNLSNSLSKSLSENAHQQAEDYLSKMKDNMTLITQLQNQLEHMDSIGRSSDTSKPIAWEAVYFFQLTRDDASLLRDTGRTYLYPDYKIWRREDFVLIK